MLAELAPPTLGARALAALLAPRRGAPASLEPGPPSVPGGPRLLRPGASGPWADAGPAVLVSTLRMGFGHYRIALAAASWAGDIGTKVFLHDPLEIPSPGGRALRRLDRAYSAGSRLAAGLGGPLERAWGALMTGGDAASLAASMTFSARLTGLMGDLPRGWPVVAAHPFSAHLAVAAGFSRVVNLVPDHHPQPFLFAPGALNLVQSPDAERQMLGLGAPTASVACAGHWVPRELALSAAADSRRRLRRREAGRPLRLLASVGGAGGQKAFFCGLIDRAAPLVRRGSARLFVNAGDRADVQDSLAAALGAAGLAYVRICGWEALEDFCARNPLDGAAEGRPCAVLVAFRDGRLACAATDRLARVSDVLATKPSELAFHPLPKLLLRRVGDHEAASARYAAALGEATPEQPDPASAADALRSLLRPGGPLGAMNAAVLEGARSGRYLGARAALSRAAAP